MTNRHLTPEEIVDLVEGRLPAARATHLDRCDTCRAQTEAMRRIDADLRVVEVPEPSPLFWEHFSARVRQAAAEVEPVTGWWQGQWWTVMAGCVAAVLVLTLSLRTPDVAVPGSNVNAGSGGSLGLSTQDEEPWEEVVQVVAQLSVEEMADMTPAEETSNLVADLTADERAAFVRLLTVEMGRAQ